MLTSCYVLMILRAGRTKNPPHHTFFFSLPSTVVPTSHFPFLYLQLLYLVGLGRRGENFEYFIDHNCVQRKHCMLNSSCGRFFFFIILFLDGIWPSFNIFSEWLCRGEGGVVLKSRTKAKPPLCCTFRSFLCPSILCVFACCSAALLEASSARSVSF